MGGDVWGRVGAFQGALSVTEQNFVKALKDNVLRCNAFMIKVNVT